MRRDGKLEPASWEEALSLIAEKIKEAKPNGKLAAFGGNTLTTEENYLFQKLMREGAGVNNIDHRIGMPIVPLDKEGIAPGMEMTIGECEELSFAVLFGVDMTEEFPVIWLRLKQAINRGATVIFLGHFAPEIAPHLKQTFVHTPGQEMEMIKQHLPAIAELAAKGKKGALFVGRQYLATQERQSLLSELLKFRQATPNVSLNILEGQGNSFGARLAGMRPDLGPLGERLSKPGLDAVQVLENAARSGWDLLYVAGSNPAAKFPSKLWSEARAKFGFLVVQDLFMNDTAWQADVVLPALSFIEKGGSFVNIEGRVQRLLPGKTIPDNIYSDGDVFISLGENLGIELALDAHFLQVLKPGRVPHSLPQTIESHSSQNSDQKGSLFATFAPKLFDQGVRMKHNPHVFHLVKEPKVRLHPSECTQRGIKEGDTVRLKANGSTITASIKLDERVAEKTVVLPLGFEAIPVHDLGTNLFNGLAIEIEQ